MTYDHINGNQKKMEEMIYIGQRKDDYIYMIDNGINDMFDNKLVYQKKICISLLPQDVELLIMKHVHHFQMRTKVLFIQRPLLCMKPRRLQEFNGTQGPHFRTLLQTIHFTDPQEERFEDWIFVDISSELPNNLINRDNWNLITDKCPCITGKGEKCGKNTKIKKYLPTNITGFHKKTGDQYIHTNQQRFEKRIIDKKEYIEVCGTHKNKELMEIMIGMDYFINRHGYICKLGRSDGKLDVHKRDYRKGKYNNHQHKNTGYKIGHKHEHGEQYFNLERHGDCEELDIKYF